MLILLYAIFLTAGLISMLFLGGSPGWSVCTILISMAYIVFRYFFSKGIRPVLINTISAAGIFLLLLVGFTSGMKPMKTGYIAYDRSMDKIESLVERGDIRQAGESLQELEKDFGFNDKIGLMKVQISMEKKDYPAALACLKSVTNKCSEPYYTAAAKWHMRQENYKEAQEVLVEAAKTYPASSGIQQMAGIQSALNKDYAMGTYFLLRAFEQMPWNSTPLYYLGVACYEQGLYQEAEMYFSDALKLGVGEDIAGYIAWYLEKMRGEVNENKN